MVAYFGWGSAYRWLSKALSLHSRAGNVLRTIPCCMISSISPSSRLCQKYHENSFFFFFFFFFSFFYAVFWLFCFKFQAKPKTAKSLTLRLDCAYLISSYPGSHDCTHTREIRKNDPVILWKPLKEKTP